MADYYPLISRAVAGLEKSTGEARRALYERARKALVDQLRGVDPPLSEADITRERLALEESIRKVETEAVRTQRPPEPAPRAPSFSSAGRAPSESPRTPQPPQTPRSERNWLDRKSGDPKVEPREGIKGFGGVVADAENLGAASAQAGRSARETYSSVPSPSPEFDRIEPRLGDDTSGSVQEDLPLQEPPPRAPLSPSASDFHRPRPPQRPPVGERAVPRAPERPRAPEPRAGSMRADLGPVIEPADENRNRPRLEPQAVPENVRRAAARAERDFDDEPEDDDKKPMFGWIAKSLIALGVIVLLLIGGAGLVYWKGGDVIALTRGMFTRTTTTTAQRDTTPPRSTKIPDRVGQPPATENNPEAAVAQRVVLYEEDPADQAGKKYVGTALWRAETAAPAAGQAPDRAVRADINIPDRMQVVWSLRRNNDKDLPASHTISIQFNLPPNFQHGGVSEIRGVLMKQSEQTRGVSLAGISVKVTNNYFLVGLSATDADVQRNIQMLKERGWFDVAIVYTDGRRAILAVEKGTPGDKAFADAFAAWGQ